MELRFFDRIEGAGRSADAADDYFYLNGISGKLGAKTLIPIDANSLKEKPLQLQTPKQAFLRVVLDIIKFLSYFTVVIPLIFLTMKAISRSKHKYTIAPKAPEHVPLPKPIVPLPQSVPLPQPIIPLPQPIISKPDPAVVAANKFLAEQRDEAKRKMLFKDPAGFRSVLFHLDFGGIFPDGCLANLPGDFEKDAEAYFIPFHDLNPYSQDGFDLLKQSLEAAFRAGKQIVTVRFGGTKHSVAAAFQADGKFRIVDSLPEGVIFDPTVLSEKLNAAQIKGSNGQVVRFHGDLINTGFQREYVRCTRFSTLSAYQMAKRRSLDAYQEVNGAFLEGRLQRFEDYVKMDGAKPVTIVGNETQYDYNAFMTSWDYRVLGVDKDSWQEVQVANVEFERLKKEDHAAMYLLKKEGLPVFNRRISHEGLQDIVWNNGNNREKIIKDIHNFPFEKIDVRQEMTVRDLLPNDPDHVHLYFGQYKGEVLERCAYRLTQAELAQLFRIEYPRDGVPTRKMFKDLRDD